MPSTLFVTTTSLDGVPVHVAAVQTVVFTVWPPIELSPAMVEAALAALLELVRSCDAPASAA